MPDADARTFVPPPATISMPLCVPLCVAHRQLKPHPNLPFATGHIIPSAAALLTPAKHQKTITAMTAIKKICRFPFSTLILCIFLPLFPVFSAHLSATHIITIILHIISVNFFSVCGHIFAPARNPLPPGAACLTGSMLPRNPYPPLFSSAHHLPPQHSASRQPFPPDGLPAPRLPPAAPPALS